MPTGQKEKRAYEKLMNTAIAMEYVFVRIYLVFNIRLTVTTCV
ncbi:hypothetical protein SAMN05421882_102742 [Nitrosomonas communis]|uniref:Uncharacterized protein n=1 Tax=Nitrosomonas communis TaxID=44574 RepID=A0A1H2WC67_9PROT|nr:hypothetical protein SAMN05421882_102742 [Nitrosomonas communis]